MSFFFKKGFSPRLLSLLLCFCATASLLISCRDENTFPSDAHDALPAISPATELRAMTDPANEVRGVYIATVYNIDFPTRSNLSADALRAELNDILNTVENAGLNTIYFQVRPVSDALYDSAIFPVSTALSTNGRLTFDPLAYLVEEGHRRNLSVHAWINPLRASLGSAKKPATDPSLLQDGSPAKEHPEWTVAYADGRLYYNPALPEVRELIAAGVREIIESYSVDGILFDDYFYPYPVTDENGITAAFDDSASYALYGDGRSLADFRRESVNEMIRLVYDTVKDVSDDVQFGVAPFGIWQNDNGTNGGSATRGLESYKTIYCDPIAWAKGGYIDYLAPQIYWRFSTSVAPFDELVRWWNLALDGTGVDLLVSHAAYNYEEWASPFGEMTEQIKFAREKITYRGSIFYGYDEIRTNLHAITDELIEVYAESILYADPSKTGMGVQISSPISGSYTAEREVSLFGTSSPEAALTVNGTPVERTKGGYFTFHAKLKVGENIFRFEQNGQAYTYIIHRTEEN